MDILSQQDLFRLCALLKQNAPYDTGALASSVQWYPDPMESNKIHVVVGVEGTIGGRDPSQYAEYTELKNKTSKGWITRTLQQWAEETKLKLDMTLSYDLGNQMTEDDEDV